MPCGRLRLRLMLCRAAEQLRADVQWEVELEPVVSAGRPADVAAVRVAPRRPRRCRPFRHAVRPLLLTCWVGVVFQSSEVGAMLQ